MIRFLKRRVTGGYLPCRGSVIVLLVFFVIVGSVFLIHSSWNKGRGVVRPPAYNRKDDIQDVCSNPICVPRKECHKQKDGQQSLEDITCRINQEVKKNIGLTKLQGAKDQLSNITCKLRSLDKEVFLPFTFIKSYFDIYGELRAGASGQKLKTKWFSWSHSYSRVFQQLKQETYDPNGTFEAFHAKPVENRDRVKCIDAKYGVPVSSQWKKEGHYYPTQICQFALSYWSKHVILEKKLMKEREKIAELSDNKSKGFQSKAAQLLKTTYENGDDIQSEDWEGSSVTRVIRDACVHFESEITLPINNDKGQYILSFDLKFGDNVTTSVTLTFPVTGDRYVIKYVPVDNLFIYQRGNVIYLGYGVVHLQQQISSNDGIENTKIIRENSWQRFTRLLTNDLMKGISKKTFEKLYKENDQRFVVEKVMFEGRDGCVTNISLSMTEHMRLFFHAADWLIDSQDSDSGGWRILVPFNEKQEKYPKAKEIGPGWYSAMSQGHALSVLTRAYRKTNDEKYLHAAINGLQLFKKPLYEENDRNSDMNSEHLNKKQTGVSSKLLNQFLWFQEYPTEPNTFVLNGFMYSLIGLYDLWHLTKYSVSSDKIGVRNEGLEAGELFLSGMKSLKTMLPFYDVTTGSVYDLRHVTMSGVEPKVARWDYHSVHINLLYLLSTIDLHDIQNDLKHSVKKNIPETEEESVLLNIAERWLGYMVGKRAQHN